VLTLSVAPIFEERGFAGEGDHTDHE